MATSPAQDDGKLGKRRQDGRDPMCAQVSDTLEGDRAWLDGFRRGDRAALARVFRAYAPDVTRTVRAARGRIPEHEVEAMVQEVFVKALAPSARDQYDGIRPFGAWLGTIARNLVTDRLRREGRVVPVEGDVLEALAAESANPTEALEAEQLERVVTAFRASLDDDERAVFRLRFEEHRSMAEAARELGWSEITVRRRDTRLRARLLDALRADGHLLNVEVRIGTSLLQRRKS